MLKPKSPQASFYGSYLYDRIIPQDHLLRKIDQTVDFSFVDDLLKDKYNPTFGRPAQKPEFMIRLCLLQYIYGDSDRKVIENARVNLAYKFFLDLAVDEDVPDDTTLSYFRSKRLGEDDFQNIFQNIVQQCIDKGLVTGRRQIIDSSHIIADMAITSLTQLLNLCRRNVVKDIAKQNPQLAEKLAGKEIEGSRKTKYAIHEEGLQNEMHEAAQLLDEVTEEFKKGNLKPTSELRKDLELLEKAVADREDKVKNRLVSPVDPDARMGKKDSKRWAGYKGHVLMDEDSEIVTAVESTPANVQDGSQLPKLIRQQEKAHDLIPQEVSADAAYDAGANLELLESKGDSWHHFIE